MCKHITFDRSRWAPCAICLSEKQNAATVKNQTALRGEIKELKEWLADCETRGRKASAASALEDIAAIEARFKKAGLEL